MIEVVFAQGNGRVELPSGAIATVHKGQHWPKTDQVVQLAPELFTDDPRFGLLYSEAPPGHDAQLNELESRVAPDVEEATANPGEKRSVRRRRADVEPEPDEVT